MKFLEHHKKDSDICPFCGSRDIHYAPGYTDNVVYYSNGECWECDRLWEDVYQYHNTQECIKHRES